MAAGSSELTVSWTAVGSFQTSQQGELVDVLAGHASGAKAPGESGPLLSVSSISSFRENGACQGCQANTEQRYPPKPQSPAAPPLSPLPSSPCLSSSPLSQALGHLGAQLFLLLIFSVKT